MRNYLKSVYVRMLSDTCRRAWRTSLWFTILLLGAASASSAQYLTFTGYSIPTSSSYPACLVNGPDGALWFTEIGEFANKIGRMTTTGAFTEYPIPTFDSVAYCITVGPDGALWFTESNASKIGRITTAGAITEYTIPTAGSNPLGIITGPDGNLWFTERQGNKIGNITTAGTFTEFSVPTSASGPVGITQGSDGAVWFAETDGNNIGRITTAGAITEYPVPTTASKPWSITGGPDGALWFTEQAAGNIGRITTSGTISEFPVPTAGSQPWGIRNGPNGDLWFVERAGNQIGSTTVAGTITEYPLPVSPGDLFGIALGSDGALWVTDQGLNSIVRAGIVSSAPGLTIFTGSLPAGSVGVSYSQTLVATFGVAPYTWSVSGGSLPSGLTLNPAAGLITGTPSESGSTTFTIQVTDASLATASATFLYNVSPNPVFDFPLPAGYLLGGITAGPDGALWFTETTPADDPSQIGRITTLGSISGFAVSNCFCEGLQGITSGPDGALWFAAGTNIGTISVLGAATEYAVPNAILLDGITTGPDGALWFTDQVNNYIGRITTAGLVSEYPVPSHGEAPDAIDAITAGPDGALWFTEQVGYIGRITTAGVVTEYPVTAQPVTITAGPDGALWWASSGGIIGRITTTGTVTEYPVPSGSSVGGITTGPDGALWFTATTADNIGRITTGGVVTQYPIPSAYPGSPVSIAAGSDGALWFTENGTDGAAIGTLLPAPTLAISPASGAQGAIVPVLLTGSSFVPGGSTVNVPSGITVSSLNVINPTQISVLFNISATMAVGPVSITVTTPGGTSPAAAFTVTAAPPPPGLTSISPSAGLQGSSVLVTLTGTNLAPGPNIFATNFLSNYTQPTTFAPGAFTSADGQLTVQATVVPDPTDSNSQWIDYNFQSVSGGPLASNLAAFWQVYLTGIPLATPGAFTGLQYYWTINGTAAPGITAVTGLQPVVPNLMNPLLGLAYGSTFPGGSPVSTVNVFAALDSYSTALLQGSMNPSTVNGFHIAARITGATFGSGTVSVGNPGVSVSGLIPISATQSTALFSVAPAAALGPANVTISNQLGTSAPPPAVTFTVLAPVPTLITISPNAGTAGGTISVILNGSNFVAGGTSITATGITVSNVVVVNSGQLTATFTIPATASGAASVTVSTANGASGPVPFTINPPPQITTVSLPPGITGTPYSQPVALSGGTSPYIWQLIAGSLPAGVLLDPATCTTPTPATACIVNGTPASSATFKFTLKVTDASGVAASAPFSLVISPAGLTVTSISPPSGSQGASVPVTITGTGFVSGTALLVSNPGISVTSVSVAGATRITAVFTIAPTAALGPANVTVSTSPTAGPPPGVTFTVVPPAPVLTSISPSAGTAGASLSITLDGSNFVSGGTTVTAPGITVSNVVVVNSGQLTAKFGVSAASAGAVSVTATTSGVTTTPIFFTINPAPHITSTLLPAGNTGSLYSQTLAVGGGTPPFTWMVTGGSLPAGLSLNPATCTRTASSTACTISGVPSTAGISTFTLQVADADGVIASAPFSLSITAPLLAITSLTPSSGPQGSTVAVSIAGSGFGPGATLVMSNPGVTASNVVVASPTLITAIFSIAADAALGPENVSVTVSGATSPASTFTVLPPAPTLTGITPAAGAPGTTVPVTLTGTNFAAGASITVHATGITANSVTVVSATQITAFFAISSGAATGPASVTVTTASGTSGSVTFTVSSLLLTSISPASGTPGATVSVTLAGAGFVSGAQVVSGSSAISVSNVTIASATEITATFAISASASPGPVNISVTVAAASSTPVTFTISPPGLTLTSITPPAGAQGTSVPITLTGTGFVAGDHIAIANAGVAASNVVVVSSTQITATFAIGSGAALGATNVTVTSGAAVSPPVTFTVLGPLTLSAISPATGLQGSSLAVTLTGTGFAPGIQITVDNPGITPGSLAVISSTQVNATLNLSAAAAIGPANVRVVEGGVTSAAVVFTVNPPAPTLTSITPSSAPQGTIVAVTLTGTNFTSGATIAVANSGVTAANVVVVNTTHITATLTVAADATLGDAAVTVNTPGGSSRAATFTVNLGVALSITGLPGTLTSGQQLSFDVSIAQPYPLDVGGQLTLQFTPAQSLPPDPMIALMGGACGVDTCTVTFQIPASQTSAPVTLQTGTENGAFVFSIDSVTVGTTQVTLSNSVSANVSVPAQAPTITSVTMAQVAGGFNIVVTGFSNTREITEADFTFTPAAGSQLQTSTFSLTNVTSVFQTYYASAASMTVGSEFVYAQPFSITAGSASTLQSVTVTLKNTQGSSSSVTTNF